MHRLLHTKWHVKPTNTFLYTHHSSISPSAYKKNAIRALYSRSQRLTSEIDKKLEAKELVKTIFLKNGYSERYIESTYAQCDQPNEEKVNRTEVKPIYLKSPFTSGSYSEIKSKTRSINKILKQSILKIAFTTFKTQDLCPNKDKIKQGELSSLAYK